MILKTISDDLEESRTRKLVGGLFLELDRIQHLLEALAGREKHAHIGDVAGGHIFGFGFAFARNADAEGAEIAQLNSPLIAMTQKVEISLLPEFTECRIIC